MDLCALRFFGAFSRVQEAFSYFTTGFVDFALKDFSGLLHLTGVDKN
jgi:hypothetical protein